MDDSVKSPRHYKLEGLNIESKEVIRAVLGKEGYRAWCHGNAMKYLFRAGKKGDSKTDYKKAIEFTSWIVEELEDAEKA